MNKRIDRIVVMGGSFNPPTVAHQVLMKAAMTAVDANLGYFVPVSDAYLRRKMRYTQQPLILSPELRIQMLNCMCANTKMQVCTNEIGTVKARTTETLKEIQAQHPESEIYFIMGDDKMKLLLHLAKKNEFFKDFKVIMFSRELPIEKLRHKLSRYNILSECLDRINLIQQPEGLETISSSAIREGLLSGKICDDMLYPGVAELIKKPQKDTETMIRKYNHDVVRGMLLENPSKEIIYFWGHTQYAGKVEKTCLSQWFDCGFEVSGVHYHTAEQYMMASKALLFNDSEIYKEIMSASDPKSYKNLGRKIKGFDAAVWDSHKYNIVVEGNKAKFSQNPLLRNYLLSTGNAVLVEASPYDRIWGIGMYESQARQGSVDSWKGENLLGYALMEVRDWLNNQN